MIVKAYGTRGSVPVSGGNKSRYGGNTTCYKVSSSRVDDSCSIILDAGSGLIPLTEELDLSKLKTAYVLFTHYHQDHILGLGLCPFMFMPQVEKKIFGPKDQGKGPMDMIGYWFQRPYFPVEDEQIKSGFVNLMDNGIASNHVLVFTGKHVTSILQSDYMDYVSGKRIVSDIEFTCPEIGVFHKSISEVLFVRNMEIAHPDRCVAYRLEEWVRAEDNTPRLRSCFVLMTDCEAMMSVPGHYKNFLNGADLLSVDCQYSMESYTKNSGFGHGNPYWVAQIARDSDIENIGIVHHDPHSTDIDVDKIVSQCKKETEKQLVNIKDINIFAIADYDEFEL